MLMKKTFLLSLLGVAAALALPAQSQWSYSFNDLKAGDLVGQDGWEGYRPAPDVTELSPQLIPLAGKAGELVLAQKQHEGAATSRARKIVPGLYDGSSTLVLELDARATGHNSVATLGFGSEAVMPATVGIMFNQFAVRDEGFDGKIHVGVDAAGKRFLPKRGQWYRIRSEWSRNGSGQWVATLAVRNLGEQGSEYTQLYFGAPTPSAQIVLSTPPTRMWGDFRLVALRVGTPEGELDNPSITSRQP